MTEDSVVHLALEALVVAMKVAAPILLVALVVGLLVSIFQAITQIQELTLAFIPKILAVGLVVGLAGPWMLDQMVSWATALFSSIPSVTGR